MYYTYLLKQWHKFPSEVWLDFFMLRKYPSLSTGELPQDLCIEIVRPIYDQEKLREQKELELKIENAEEENNHYYASWKAFGNEYESEYRAREADLLALREELISLRDDDILTNPDSAYQFLADWHGHNFLEEKEIVSQLVNWFKIINEMSSDLADSYVNLLQIFFEKNNLRYLTMRNADELSVTFNPAFIASERFLTVRDVHCDSAHLKVFYTDFENCFGDLLKNQRSTQVKSTIDKSSHLVEALANRSTGKTGKTLSDILRSYLPIDCFPHFAAKDTLSKLYTFFSDYPGIRHAGTANSATRTLSERDAFLFGSMSVLFADYLSRRECPICGSDMVVESISKTWICTKSPVCAGSRTLV